MQHGEQSHNPHSREIIAEMVMNESIPNTIRERSIADLIPVYHAEIIIHAGNDRVNNQSPVLVIEGLDCFFSIFRRYIRNPQKD